MSFTFRLNRLELTNFHKFDRYAVDFDDSLTIVTWGK